MLNGVYDLGVFDCSIATVRFRFCNSILSTLRNAVFLQFVSHVPSLESTLLSLLPMRHLLLKSNWPSRVPGDFLRNMLFYPPLIVFLLLNTWVQLMEKFGRREQATHRSVKPPVIYVYYIQKLGSRFHRFSRADRMLPIRPYVLPSLFINPYFERSIRSNVLFPRTLFGVFPRFLFWPPNFQSHYSIILHA